MENEACRTPKRVSELGASRSKLGSTYFLHSLIWMGRFGSVFPASSEPCPGSDGVQAPSFSLQIPARFAISVSDRANRLLF